ncbi:t-SNARE domain-containing protein 1 [Habropoda laboriosa]|uniref:t-SNARE domain-containing protein 1 n=1 Tax=Habropoda laboriosa TaxID=597456 RepID=A0A0L7R603_9HYME|nr:PREDICTED: syntaxin-12 [Habropoda laboriosa]KOC66249.1 t-SNARE domain-containing protein 1 [Habropoda laboriosa]
MAHSSQTYGSTDQRTDVPDVGFSPTELYSLSENITTNIYTINSSWRILEHANKNIGTNKDNQSLRDRVHVTQLSTNQVVTRTSKDIARLTVLMKKGDKQQKLQIEKLTNDFRDALQRYSDMQKSIAEKMKRPILLTSSIENSMDIEEEEQQLLHEITEKAIQRDLEFEHSLEIGRSDKIKQIEENILDVNEIMRELVTLVYQQGEAVNVSENNIENVHANVELGRQELIKASNYESKYRRKIYILLLLAIIVVVILIIVLVTKLS